MEVLLRHHPLDHYRGLVNQPCVPKIRNLWFGTLSYAESPRHMPDFTLPPSLFNPTLDTPLTIILEILIRQKNPKA